MKFHYRQRASGWVLGTVVAVSIGSWQEPQACALEPMINGGFTVSHPASINVAVAVADARRDGLLPQASTDPMPNDIQLNWMLSDLRKLNKRLDGGRKAMTERPRSFSLVLIGPGLWSHFHVSPSAMLARYHTKGPLDGKVTVITHHAVVQALLNGNLTAEVAFERGLLAYADGDAVNVRQLFEVGLRAS